MLVKITQCKNHILKEEMKKHKNNKGISLPLGDLELLLVLTEMKMLKSKIYKLYFIFFQAK